MASLLYAHSMYSTEQYGIFICEYVKRVRHIIKTDEQVVGMIGSGSSGSMMASGVLRSLVFRPAKREICYIHIQKYGANAHNGGYNGPMQNGHYIFIDDFIQSGATYRWCLERMEYFSPDSKISYILIWGRFGREFRPPKNVKFIEIDPTTR